MLTQHFCFISWPILVVGDHDAVFGEAPCPDGVDVVEVKGPISFLIDPSHSD